MKILVATTMYPNKYRTFSGIFIQKHVSIGKKLLHFIFYHQKSSDLLNAMDGLRKSLKKRGGQKIAIIQILLYNFMENMTIIQVCTLHRIVVYKGAVILENAWVILE